jgi:hypothetical protein
MRSVTTLVRLAVGRSTKRTIVDSSKSTKDISALSSSAGSAEPLARQFGQIVATILKGALLHDKNDATGR